MTNPFSQLFRAVLIACFSLSLTSIGSDEWAEFTVKAPDGVVTPALLRRPSGSGPFPVVVFFHGAPGAQGSEALRRIATEGAGAIRWQRFIEEGIAVCIADYRGHPPNMPFEVLRGEVNAADDALAVVRYLRGQPFIEASRVGLIGGSLGGAIVLAAMQRDSVAAIALNAPATFPFLGFRSGQLPQDCSLALPDSAIDRSGALQRIGLIRSPSLIVQGTADTLCSLNRKLYELMIEAGKDASLKLYEGQPHGFTNGPDSPAFRQALEDTNPVLKRITGSLPKPLIEAQREGAGAVFIFPNPENPERYVVVWTTRILSLPGNGLSAGFIFPVNLLPDYALIKEGKIVLAGHFDNDWKLKAAAQTPPPQIPEGVRVLRDVEYARVAGKALLLDLYLPEKSAGKLPVIVSVHGGGWTAGNKEASPGLRFSGRGYAVASINYRLSGEAIFPAQIEDCKAAIRWLRANAEKYNLDSDCIAAWGASAGGHLVALLGTSGGVKELEGGGRVERVNEKFRGLFHARQVRLRTFRQHVRVGEAEQQIFTERIICVMHALVKSARVVEIRGFVLKHVAAIAEPLLQPVRHPHHPLGRALIVAQ